LATTKSFKNLLKRKFNFDFQLISQHPNVVTCREIVVGSDMDRIYIGETAAEKAGINIMLFELFSFKIG
jgi:Tfp pilus assembly PilM family ATPase